MLIYLSIFAAMALTGLLVKDRSQQNIALAVFAVFLLFFMGTRFETGCDFAAYQMRFLYNYKDPDYLAYLQEHEPGFHWLNVLVHQFGLSYMWLNVFASLIFLLCIVRFVQLSPTPMLLLAVLFPIVILQLGMSGLRQGLAVAFLTQALVSFVQVQRVSAGLWVLLAAQFHTSAYLFLPLALMAGRQFRWYMAVIAVVVLGPASVFLLGERADVYSARYIEQIYGENASGGAWLRYSLAVLPCILCEYFSKQMQQMLPKIYPLFRVVSLLTFALAPIGILSSVALHRLTFYVLPATMLMFIYGAMALPKARMLSRRFLFIPAGVLLVYMLGWFLLSRHSSVCYVPYESYLF